MKFSQKNKAVARLSMFFVLFNCQTPGILKAGHLSIFFGKVKNINYHFRALCNFMYNARLRLKIFSKSIDKYFIVRYNGNINI